MYTPTQNYRELPVPETRLLFGPVIFYYIRFVDKLHLYESVFESLIKMLRMDPR